MKTKLFVIFVSFTSLVNGDNSEISFEKKQGTKKDTVAILGIRDNLNIVFEAAKQKANEFSNNTKIDTIEARNYINSVAAGRGWTAEVAAEKTAELILEAEKILNEKMPAFRNELITEINDTYLLAANIVEPKALFQADYEYLVTKENENIWSRGGVNLNSLFNGFILKGDATIGFSAGVAVGLSADIDFKLFLTVEASFVLDGFNPVGPVSGNGRSITIKATPKWRSTIGGAAGGEAFLKLNVGLVFPGNGVLADIQSTLSI